MQDFTPLNAKNALQQIAINKGVQRAKLIEKIFRLETNHFKSLQYKKTGSAGMEDGKWFDLKKGTYTTIEMDDNSPTRGVVKFIRWNNVYDAMEYLSDYIDRHNGNFARWNSTNTTKQQKYSSIVNSIKNQYV